VIAHIYKERINARHEREPIFISGLKAELMSKSPRQTGLLKALPTGRGRLRIAASFLSSLCFLFTCMAPNIAPAAGKRVLLVHSFGSAAPPFTTHSIAFETELAHHENVDLDEVSLDHSRFADADMEEALVAFLQKRDARWQPDLVVPVGSPAGVFVANYRQRLFPRTPILYTGMDKRRLPDDALQDNAAFVGESFDGPCFIEDMLQIAPDTTNIVCVIGASQVERYWKAAFQNDFARFTNGVSFTWLDHLPFDQMLDRVQQLPPHSFIFLILLMRDAAGVTHDADEALRRISEVANAPVNSIFEHQLGLGIVGGRLYRAQAEGIESARLALRILHGESPTNFAPLVVDPTGPQYDSRELGRWKISEDRLPPGSIVKYREPTLWAQHKALIVAAAVVVLVQSLLIAALLVSRARRLKAERSLRETQTQFWLIANSAPIMIWTSGPDKLCNFFNQPWLTFRGRTMEQEIGNGWSEGVHPDDLANCLTTYSDAFDARLPFMMDYRLRRHDGQYRWVSDRGAPRYDAANQFLGYVGSCVDVTEKKELEAEIQLWYQDLAHVSRVTTLGVLAGSLAHELKQPLTAIVSTAEAGHRLLDAGKITLAELRDLLKDVADQGLRGGEIITGMRAMLKKDTGKLAPQDMNQLLTGVLEMLRTDLVTRSVTPLLRLEGSLPQVNGDAVQLRQLLLNLVVNACDAMSEEPVGQRKLTIQSRTLPANELEFAVADSGPGFPDEMLRDLFVPFRSTKSKGLGLGLVICRSIVTAHGGQLVVANNAPKGAKITFTLPLS